MSRENGYYEITDAFLALRDVDDEAIEGMLRADRKAREERIHEGKSFSIQSGSNDVAAAKQFISEQDESDDEIEVIDVDADTVDHLKKNVEYIGQGILSCNRCKTNRFIDMDLLTASEVDDEVFNVDDECPHCHDAGSGYTLIGQVGKVQNETEEEPAAAEAEVSNDEAPAEDDATFDNDMVDDAEGAPVEDEAESSEESQEAETLDVDVDVFEEEPESDGMETETSEDELDDLDLPSLGDEVDSDETEEDEDNKVKEALVEDVKLNAMAEEAWMMNRVISAMNNEDAYFGSWLYIWPDGESKEECAYDFGDRESFEELKETFVKIYKRYHSDGLYDAAPEVLEYAHNMDSQLGLAKIDNLSAVKPLVRESLECDVAGDILNSIIDCDKISKIIVFDVSDEESEPRELYKGNREDLPLNVIGSPCKSFDVADGYLSCNIDSDVENTNRPLSKALESFCDDTTDKVLVWDQAKDEEVFSGTKADACERFGNCEFVSFETPAVIRININNPSILSLAELEDDEVETDVDKLVKKIIDANNMSQYKIDKPTTNEYWINSCLHELDDVELIYESFVKPTENKALIKEFKSITGYTNALEEAFEAGFAAAGGNEEKVVVESVTDDADDFEDDQEAVVEQPTCDRCGKRLNDSGTCPACDHGEEELESVQQTSNVRSFKTRKELAEAVNTCKNNNQAYMIKRSKTEGFRYDLITEDVSEPEDEEEITSLVPAEEAEVIVVDDIAQELPAEYSPRQLQVMNSIHRIATDIAAALEHHYGVEASAELIVEDIMRDLRLISGDVSVDDLGDSAVDRATAELFRSYNDFYAFVDELITAETGSSFRTTPDMKLRQAISMLNGPQFATENIHRMIGSTAFLQAAHQGQVPYIGDAELPLLDAANESLESDVTVEESAHVCERCGKEICECDTSESLDVDTAKFDSDMNEYFNESYDDTVLYTTTGGSIEADGRIVLEGLIQCEEVIKPVTFTLTPEHEISEDATSFEKLMTEKFKVTNNISEEVFEFSFND